MPRAARIVLPDYPHHVIHRGHNRQAVFLCDDDYRYYLDNLREWKEVRRCRVYAFCLMTNHVHLVIAPGPLPLVKLCGQVGVAGSRLAGP